MSTQPKDNSNSTNSINDQKIFLINQINRLSNEQKKSLLLEVTKLETNYDNIKSIYPVCTGTALLLDKFNNETIIFMCNHVNKIINN
jgi:hypothetical protein